MSTIREATYDLLRTLGLTTVFGNPGSTEETFLQNFPSDFTYVLGLQEAPVVAMADGYAQGHRRAGPGQSTHFCRCWQRNVYDYDGMVQQDTAYHHCRTAST